MSSVLRFGIIGCGRIAQRHALHIANTGKLLAACDVIAEKAHALSSAYGAKTYTDINQLLDAEKEIDVIAICTPNGLHAAHSIQALDAGFHVLCEKPMALSSKDCANMIAAAEHNKKKLFIIKQNRYNPPVAAVKKLLTEQKLGKIFSVQLNCYWNRGADYYTDWKGTKELDGGTLYTQFSHFIDLLYWMFGDVINIQAMLANLAHQNIIEFEDTGVVNFEFANQVLGGLHYTVNAHGKNMEGSLTIFGEKGTVKIGGEYLNELEYQHLEDLKIEHLPAGNHANDYGKYTGSMSNHGLVYQNLKDVLLNDASMTTSAQEGLKTVEIIERIYQSAIWI